MNLMCYFFSWGRFESKQIRQKTPFQRRENGIVLSAEAERTSCTRPRPKLKRNAVLGRLPRIQTHPQDCRIRGEKPQDKARTSERRSGAYFLYATEAETEAQRRIGEFTPDSGAFTPDSNPRLWNPRGKASRQGAQKRAPKRSVLPVRDRGRD